MTYIFYFNIPLHRKGPTFKKLPTVMYVLQKTAKGPPKATGGQY